jgi:hypothetical protein
MHSVHETEVGNPTTRPLGDLALYLMQSEHGPTVGGRVRGPANLFAGCLVHQVHGPPTTPEVQARWLVSARKATVKRASR